MTLPLRRPLLRLLAGLLPAALLLAGACSRRQEFRSAYSEQELQLGSPAVADAEALRAALEARVISRPELWVKSDVTARQEQRRGRTFFSALLLHRAPDKLRLRGSRQPIGTVFDVLLDGDKASLFFPRDGRVYDGTREELGEKLGLLGGLTPSELLAAVLVQEQLRVHLRAGAAVTEPGEEHLLVAARHTASQRQFFWMVRRADGLTEEFLVRSPEGVEELRVRYSAWERAQAPDTAPLEALPSRFTLTVPAHRITVECEVEQYKLGVPLPDAAFRPAQASERLPLNTLVFEGEP